MLVYAIIEQKCVTSFQGWGKTEEELEKDTKERKLRKCMALRRKLEIKIGGKKTNKNFKSHKEGSHV